MPQLLIPVVLFMVSLPVVQAETTTVLVFPFENLSNDRNVDWIGEGISELIKNESERLIWQATRLSPRLERWIGQPLPRLVRLSTTTNLGGLEGLWTDGRLARQARGRDLTVWLESIQGLIDSHQYGEAIRELNAVIRLYPGSAEARTLLDEIPAESKRNRK